MGLRGAVGARIDVTGVTVRFSGVHVLEDVSFTADPGTVHAVIGPNGAGKSTLFNVLSGIYRPTVGSVMIDEKEIVGLKPFRVARAGIGRAFQNSSMFASLTVEQNMLLGRHRLTRSGVIRSGLRLPFARAEERGARAKVREIAKFVEVDHLLDRTAGDLAYGDAKRVDVARALCTEPSVLLLDEPVAGMHTREKVAMRLVIKRVSRELGTTILLVEHDMGVVMGVSDRITVLHFGTVLVTGSPEDVRNDPSVVEAYLGQSTARKDPVQAHEKQSSSQQTSVTLDLNPPAASQGNGAS